jgi:hypothetical protein
MVELSLVQLGQRSLVMSKPSDPINEFVGADAFDQKKFFCLYEIGRCLSVTMGKVLTIVDATVTEPRQNKAVKDLIKSSFYESQGEMSEWAVERDQGGDSSRFVVQDSVATQE